MRIGFIGLGRMGYAMALSLSRAGHALAVWNRTRARMEALAAEVNAAGGYLRIASGPADVALGREIVFTMLADDAAVETLVFGPLLAALPPEAVHVSSSTISVGLSKRLATVHRDAGQAYVAAPVFGRPEMANEGKLWIAVAGAADAIARARPALEVLSRGIAVVSTEPAAANAVKICGNFLIAAMLEACGEAFALAERHGVERGVLLETVNAVFGSPLYARYGGRLASERWEFAGFNLELGLKDIRLALAAADAMNVPMPIASLLRDNAISGVARGFGECDWSVIGGLALERAGFDIKAQPKTG